MRWIWRFCHVLPRANSRFSSEIAVSHTKAAPAGTGKSREFCHLKGSKQDHWKLHKTQLTRTRGEPRGEQSHLALDCRINKLCFLWKSCNVVYACVCRVFNRAVIDSAFLHNFKKRHSVLAEFEVPSPLALFCPSNDGLFCLKNRDEKAAGGYGPKIYIQKVCILCISSYGKAANHPRCPN